MLSKDREKLIRSLKAKKGREKNGLCLVEGRKNIKAAGHAVEFVFTRADTEDFDRLVDAETPQDVAAVARIPDWMEDEILSLPTIVVLDGVQDPGNVGAVFRLCLGFDASLLLVDSADPSAPKTIRASAGSFFLVPWMRLPRADAAHRISSFGLPVYRLEKRPGSQGPETMRKPRRCILLAGSEGSGITLGIEGRSVAIPHAPALESLNVGHAVAIALYERMKRKNGSA